MFFLPMIKNCLLNMSVLLFYVLNRNLGEKVGTERNFRRSYIIRYEDTLPIKLSYFKLQDGN